MQDDVLLMGQKALSVSARLYAANLIARSADFLLHSEVDSAIMTAVI